MRKPMYESISAARKGEITGRPGVEKLQIAKRKLEVQDSSDEQAIEQAKSLLDDILGQLEPDPVESEKEYPIEMQPDPVQADPFAKRPGPLAAPLAGAAD